MSWTVVQEFVLLIALTGTGMGIGLFFDCYRLLCRRIKPGYLLTQLTDLVFWIISAGAAFYVFFVLAGGLVRIFTILWIPVGMALYLRFASNHLQEPLSRLLLLLECFFRLLLRTVCFCWQAILFPFRLAVWTVNFALQFACGLLRLFFLPIRCTWRWFWRLLREWWRALRRNPRT